jgi:hypothetical protein
MKVNVVQQNVGKEGTVNLNVGKNIMCYIQLNAGQEGIRTLNICTRADNTSLFHSRLFNLDSDSFFLIGFMLHPCPLGKRPL